MRKIFLLSVGLKTESKTLSVKDSFIISNEVRQEIEKQLMEKNLVNIEIISIPNFENDLTTIQYFTEG